MKIQRNNYEKATRQKNCTGNQQAIGLSKNQLRQGIPMSYNKFRLKNSPDQIEFDADFIPDTG